MEELNHMFETDDPVRKYKELLIRYNSLFEETRDIVYTCDAESRIASINPYGVSALGYSSKSELLGLPVSSLYRSPGDREHYLGVIGEKGYIKDFEIILKKKNGDTLIGLESAQAITSPNSKIVEFAGIIKDITERVEHEMLLVRKNIELVDANKKLEEAQIKIMRQDKLASIGQLAAGIAHEINNPLAYIKSCNSSLKIYMEKVLEYVKLLEEGHPERMIEARKQLKIDLITEDFTRIHTETNEGFDKITSIINGLKNFAHVDTAHTITRYDLNNAVEITLQMLRNEINHVANVEKKFTDLPQIECFGGEINQVLLNIILNAAQAIKQQKRDTKGTITIETLADEPYVLCTIRDDGPGVPEKIRDKIFEPFFTTKEAGEGTGLGLNISYDIVMKHGGDLVLKSGTGEGAAFQIRLPIRSALLQGEDG
jgi:two-component system NtrC family sensor kinase